MLTGQVAWNVKKTNIHGWCHKLRTTKMLDIFFSVVLGVFYPSSKQKMNIFSYKNRLRFESIGFRHFPRKPSEFEILILVLSIAYPNSFMKLFGLSCEEYLQDSHDIQMFCTDDVTERCESFNFQDLLGVHNSDSECSE